MSDLIRREDAIQRLERLKVTYPHADISMPIDLAIETLQNLAKPNNTCEVDLISREDAVTEIHKYFVAEIEKTPTVMDEDDDELYADMTTVNSLLACNKELSKRIKALPSADRPTKHTLPDGTEILIDEESYEIGYSQGQMADRPTGEWVRLEREENVYDLHGVPTWGINYMCDKCGFITTAIQDHFV